MMARSFGYDVEFSNHARDEERETSHYTLRTGSHIKDQGSSADASVASTTMFTANSQSSQHSAALPLHDVATECQQHKESGQNHNTTTQKQASKCMSPVVQTWQRKPEYYLRLNPMYPKLNMVYGMPPIYIVDDFLGESECQYLIEQGQEKLQRSIVVDSIGGETSAPARTSHTCFLPKLKTQWLDEKLEELTKAPRANFEPAQVCRYDYGQFYKAHYDAFDLTTQPGRRCAETGGQRIATVLIYLNTVEKGGHTTFPKLNLKFSPIRGRALIFFPATLDGSLDTLALHCGEDAIEEKWLCQVWIRQQEFGRSTR